MRRGDHNAARLRMEREQWERQCEQENEAKLEQMEAKSKKYLIDRIFSPLQEANYAKIFGGGEYGQKMAAMITKVKFDLPLEDPPKPEETQTCAGPPPPAVVEPQAQERHGTLTQSK